MENITGSPAATQEMTLTPDARASLQSTVSWSKFVAIAYFILTGFMLIMGITTGGLVNSLYGLGVGELDYYSSAVANSLMGGFSAFYMVMIILGAALYFFYGFFLIMYATKTKKALQENNVVYLEAGLRNMKNFWIYNGVLMIIGLAFMAIIMFGVIIAASFAGAII